MPARRGSFTILLGIALTPLAGFLGVVVSALSPLWLFGLGLGLLAAPVFLAVSLVTVFKGALYAWPLTCMILPLTAVFVRPVTHISFLVFALVGLIGGPLSFTFMSSMSDAAMHPDSFRSLAAASAFAGVILGTIFGFIVWRYDRLTFERTDNSASRRTLKLGMVLSAAFLIVALVGLAAIPPS
jgi:putative flippase GtrA